MQDTIARVVTPPPPPTLIPPLPHRLPGTFVIPKQHWKRVVKFAKWTKAGESEGCRLRNLTTCKNLQKDGIYEVHIRLVGGFDCQKITSVLSEQPPFKNGKQFQRWINRHEVLNNILLAKWVHEIVAMPPDNRPSNFVIMFIAHILGRDIRQLGHIFSGIAAVRVWGVKYGTVGNKSVGNSVRQRKAKMKIIDEQVWTI